MRRIDFELQLQANRSDSELDSEEPPAASTLLHAPSAPGLMADTPDPNTSHYDDVTMPSWNQLGLSGASSYGGQLNFSSTSSEDDIEEDTGLATNEPEGVVDYLHGTDSESDLGPEEVVYDQSGDTDIGYTSGSEADVDTDDDMYTNLDDLEWISPASTRAPSPNREADSEVTLPPALGENDHGDSNHEVPEHDTGDPRQTDEDETGGEGEPQELPDALRAFREWILKMSSTGDLTVEASESLLKTLNMCLEKDLLRCGPEINTSNLPPHLRNLPENKILVGVTPGPHEPNVDTINNFLRPMVDELLELWNDGMNIKSESGETVKSHVALVACACDSPAARKLGGFGEFSRRTRKEHKRAARVYRNLPNKSQKQKHISTKYEKGKPAGYRDSVLLRLPYWDATKMVVVDPMHCLFLGIVDWQFHTIWVDMKHLRPGEELDELQTMVQSTVRPRHCGRPPGGLGTSAAGSLTSDPLRSLVTIDLPLAIPILWDQVDETSVQQRAYKEWTSRRKAQQKRKDKVQKEKATAVQPNSQSRKRARTQQIQNQLDQGASDGSEAEMGNPNTNTSTEVDSAREQGLLSWRYEDAEGILWLCRAIKRLCSRTVTAEDIEQGHLALVQYLNIFAAKNGADQITILHCTFRRSYVCLVQCIKLIAMEALSLIAANQSDQLSEWAASMLQFGRSPARGTYEADVLNPEDTQNTLPARHKKPITLTLMQKVSLAIALARAQPQLTFRREAWEHGNSPLLSDLVYPIREVIRNGRVFSMSSLGDSIIKAHTVEEQGIVERVGEIIDLWEHRQLTTGNTLSINTFALVRWYKASTIFRPRPVVLWSNEFPDLDIEIHVPNEYLEHHAVISTSDIVCHCARMSATLDGQPVWLSIGLERFDKREFTIE
ncbi:transposase family tnp2 protein, partial [Rhizoctonia solani AG-3 Rhs1AP]